MPLTRKDQKDVFPSASTSVAPQIEQTETTWKHEMQVETHDALKCKQNL